MQNIRQHLTDDGVCVLTFDRPNSSANIFDRATLTELDESLGQLADAKGLVLISAKQSIFVAGADLHSLSSLREGDLEYFVELGQRVFTCLAQLTIPTIAAIHGAALGGGYELCLACDYRIASPDSATRIGLPETKLGILPAWGGSTRLPRLIGVPKALDVILGGKVLPAKAALKYGMIDEIAPREYLLKAASRVIEKGVPRRKRGLLGLRSINGMVGSLIAPRVRAKLQKKTRGHYPALTKALDVIVSGASSWREEESFARERTAVLELVKTDACRNLMSLFQLQERAKKLKFPAATDVAVEEVKQVAVIGAGVMGAAITQWLSARKLRVILRDVNADRVAAGMDTVGRLYAAGVKRHVFTAIETRDGLDRISPAPSEVPLNRADIIIEAAVEKMDLKKQIFARLDELAGGSTILATNTSALSISEIGAATKNPGRVIGVHFFNPVHKMQLVEVVVGRETRPDVVRRTLQFVQRIGKLPVIVRDSPGFLVNRILLPYLVEAAHFFEMGASVAEIDEAMLDFGMPMGPMRLIDEVGVDVSADVAAELASAFTGRLTVPEILPKMIEAGLLGRKNGKGFYLHEKGAEARVNEHADKFRKSDAASSLSRPELERRMVLLMVNEAARCLEEGIVATPGDVDFGMVMGTGFAPFRGGPLAFADTAGIAKVADEMSRLAEVAGPHYEPCARLKTMAAEGTRFYEN